ncbi:MAG: hypothetical protein ACREX0_04030 [Noviherbaspirillum sp.]
MIALIQAASTQHAVVAQELTNGMQLLVYPMDEGLMVGFGYESYAAHKARPEQMVRKRSEDMRRFGAWHPAMLADGGLYVVRRLRQLGTDRGTSPLSEDELLAAEELLS